MGEGPDSSSSGLRRGAVEPQGGASLQRVLGEITWFGLFQAGASVLSWVAAVALARVLDRRDFGVYGICAFYVGIGSLLGDGGMGAALLRRRGNVSRVEYQVTLTLLLALAVLSGVVLFAAAPALASANHLGPRGVHALRAMSPLFFLSALRVVPYVRLQRALLLSRIARIEVAAALVRHSLAIALAVAGFGVDALVYSAGAGALAQVALAYRASPGWVGVAFSWRALRPLLGYGAQVQGLGVLAYLKDNVSRALLGATMGPASVGAFDFGLAYIEGPVVAVNNLARVQLPVYARYEPNDPELARALRAALRAALLIGLPLLGVLAIGAPWIVPLVYGPKWIVTYPVIWGLLGNMMAGLLASPMFALLQGQGRAASALKVFALWSAGTWALAVAVAFMRPGGLGPLAMAYSVATVVTMGWLVRRVGERFSPGLWSALAGPVWSAALGLALGFAVLRLGHGRAGHPLLGVAAYVLTYGVALFALEGRQVLTDVREVLSSARRPPRAPATHPTPALRRPVSARPAVAAALEGGDVLSTEAAGPGAG